MRVTQIDYVIGTKVGQAGGAPSTTTAGADTTYPFASEVHQLSLWNKSNSDVFFEFDAAASQGSRVVRANQVVVNLACRVTNLHLWCSAAININGSADGNIFLEGWN